MDGCWGALSCKEEEERIALHYGSNGGLGYRAKICVDGTVDGIEDAATKNVMNPACVYVEKTMYGLYTCWVVDSMLLCSDGRG